MGRESHLDSMHCANWYPGNSHAREYMTSYLEATHRKGGLENGLCR